MTSCGAFGLQMSNSLAVAWLCNAARQAVVFVAACFSGGLHVLNQHLRNDWQQNIPPRGGIPCQHCVFEQTLYLSFVSCSHILSSDCSQ